MSDDLRNKLPFLRSIAEPAPYKAIMDALANAFVDALIRALNSPYVPQSLEEALEDSAQAFAQDDMFIRTMQKAVEPHS